MGLASFACSRLSPAPVPPSQPLPRPFSPLLWTHRGRRVAITANSHKVITNLMAKSAAYMAKVRAGWVEAEAWGLGLTRLRLGHEDRRLTRSVDLVNLSLFSDPDSYAGGRHDGYGQGRGRGPAR